MSPTAPAAPPTSTRGAWADPAPAPAPAGVPLAPAAPDVGASGEDAGRVVGAIDLQPPGCRVADARSSEPGPPANQVQLRGRISHIDDPRVLPSGDTVVQLRLVVPRDRPTPRGGGARDQDGSRRAAPGVDTIDVACWSPATQRAAARIGVDGLAEVVGVLRRRFFRSGSGAASRYEVEARRIRRLSPAPRHAAGATGDA